MELSIPGSSLLFEYAPISLWLKDYSDLKKRLDSLHAAGVTDLDLYLNQNPPEVDACLTSVRILDVNQKTLTLFGAADKETLISGVSLIFRDDMRLHFQNELVDIWKGKTAYHREGVNYALSGEPIEILLHLRVLPGFEQTLARVLVSLEDLRDLKRMERDLARSEAHFRGLFANSPISLWEEDYSQVKAYLDQLRAAGVYNLSHYLDENPAAVETCMGLIRVVSVNRKTLAMFSAASLEELTANLGLIFRGEMRIHFRSELIEMWNGNLEYTREGINYSLTGDPIEIELYWTVLPGHEHDFSRVMVCLTDITSRKQAERYMQYLGTHDSLTGLYNRHYFQEECKRLQSGRRFPICILVMDIDGLKQVNDAHGHIAGDDLLRRTAEVLRHSFRGEDLLARLGGDEFAVVLPETDISVAQVAVARIEKMLEINNSYYHTPLLNISIGVSCGDTGSMLDDILREADDRMYQNKRQNKQGLPPASDSSPL